MASPNLGVRAPPFEPGMGGRRRGTGEDIVSISLGFLFPYFMNNQIFRSCDPNDLAVPFVNESSEPAQKVFAVAEADAW